MARYLLKNLKPHAFPNDKRFINLAGRRFGMLLVLFYCGQDAVGNKIWKCECDCSQTKFLRAGNLKSGHTTSCGCVKNKLIAARVKKHGKTYTAEYNSWCSLKGRCENPKNSRFRRYGGRGITVCKRWIKSFANFLKDMGERPSPKHSIDRMDNDGHYKPSNCRWATAKEQANNRSTNSVKRVLVAE